VLMGESQSSFSVFCDSRRSLLAIFFGSCKAHSKKGQAFRLEFRDRDFVHSSLLKLMVARAAVLNDD